jgi:hypothetical protein
MKKVSARLKKFIQKASMVPYTNEELQKLHDLVEGDDASTWIERIQNNKREAYDYGSFETVLHDQMKYGGFDIDRPVPGETYSDSKQLNFLQYLLVYHRREFLFLVCVPNRNVPLYIGDDLLRVFVQWRLLINK